MTFAVPVWILSLSLVLTLPAALFWGAPIIALVSEILGAMTGKPFPGRCARQMSRLAVQGHLLVWVLFCGAGAVYVFQGSLESPFLAANQTMLLLTAALPFFGTLALIAYDLSWKKAKENKLFHILLGSVANVPVKCGYWGLLALLLVRFRGMPMEHPAFFPPLASPLWPLACLWLPLALALGASLGLVYLIVRRNRDDWGRDYYRFAAPFLAGWQIFGAALTLMAVGWLWYSLHGIWNLWLPQILYPLAAGAACMVLTMPLAISLCLSEHPMRRKGSILGILCLTGLFCVLLCASSLEAALHYLPEFSGWIRGAN